MCGSTGFPPKLYLAPEGHTRAMEQFQCMINNFFVLTKSFKTIIFVIPNYINRETDSMEQVCVANSLQNFIHLACKTDPLLRRNFWGSVQKICKKPPSRNAMLSTVLLPFLEVTDSLSKQSYHRFPSLLQSEATGVREDQRKIVQRRNLVVG